MTSASYSFSVKVDLTNPGQYFACCGLLELAHRLWSGVEGWFDLTDSTFLISSDHTPVALAPLLNNLRQCGISGLSEEERREKDALEAESRRLKKQNQKLSDDREKRRKELGTLAREGAVRLQDPFTLVLDWWQTGDDDPATPKTWAGRQEVHKVARAAQDALSKIDEPVRFLDCACVLRVPQEYQRNKADGKKPVEPFYFDSRRFAHALDTGFSLDVQDAETIAHAAVELLSLIGLQRFRPSATSDRWSFEYWAWVWPLAAPVAASVVGGAVPIRGRERYRFRLLFRDDQRRYKAFSPATPFGGES